MLRFGNMAHMLLSAEAVGNGFGLGVVKDVGFGAVVGLLPDQ